MSELGHPDLIVEARNGFLAPVGTPNQMVDKLNQQIRVLHDPKVSSKFAEMYTEVVFGSPEDYTAANLTESIDGKSSYKLPAFSFSSALVDGAKSLSTITEVCGTMRHDGHVFRGTAHPWGTRAQDSVARELDHPSRQ
jgi:hypothetical protein